MRIPALLTLCIAAALGAPSGGESESRAIPVTTIPHITAGDGWKTTIRIPNPTRNLHEIRVESYMPNGAPWEIEINGRAASSQTLQVPPLGVLDVELTRSGPNLDGYACLVFLSAASLPHTVLYFAEGALLGAVGKTAGAQYTADYFQFDNTGSGTTGIAFLVPFNSSDANHRLTCYAANGSVLGAYSFPVSGTRSPMPGGFQKILFATPDSLNSTEDLKGTCHFSFSTAAYPAEKAAARPVISLRFVRQGFLPLTH